MRTLNRALSLLAPLALTLLLSPCGFADPPARIGRLNYLSGSVSFRPADLDDWSPAIINVPLKTGDHLWTDTNSQAELHVGSAAVRLGPQTAFAFLNIDDQTTQIQLTEGAVNVRLRELPDTEVFEIDTPNAAISLLRPGWYRVTVDNLGNTTLTDRLGESEVTALGSAFTVHPQETATITGTSAPAFDVVAVLPPDAWDNWCSARDGREEQARSVQYVSREMVGYEDLDDFGVWRPVPDYGVVWVPSSVPAGWAPYRFGHWIWVEPWGWTWVDDMPWGFAPFHYGRWAFVQGAWVWVPGRVVARPVYAPALVVFVGGNTWHASLAIGSGVAWFPLGPREVYVPAYRVSDTYVRDINVTHVNVTNINVTNVNVVNRTYVNRTVPGAVTAVPQAAFVRAQAVGRAAVTVPQQAVATAPIGGMTATVAPRPESLAARPAAASVVVARPPEQLGSRTVVARKTPPPPPVPFAARQSALAAEPGRPLDPEAVSRLRQATPAPRPFVRPATPAPASNSQPAQTLRPAREGLQTPHPVTASPAPPSPAAAAQPPQRGRTFENSAASEKNDRPSAAAAPRPAVKPPETRPVQREQERPPAPAHPQEPVAERGRSGAPPRPEAQNGPRGNKPTEGEGKAKSKAEESGKAKNENRKNN